MPDAMAAAASACIAASGSSAITVTDSLAALSLPAGTPPNLRKSFSLMSATLPTPTTMRRSALIPSGAGISSVDPLLPLNWVAAAPRFTVLARHTDVRARPRPLRGVGRRPQRLPRRLAKFQCVIAKPHENATVRGGKSDKADLDGVGHKEILQNSGLLTGPEFGPHDGMFLFGNGPNRSGPDVSAT